MPLEIRRKIYDELYASSKAYFPTILAVCHQTNEEAAELLYKNRSVAVRFTDEFALFENRDIFLRPRSTITAVKPWCFLPASFKHCRTLHISFGRYEWQKSYSVQTRFTSLVNEILLKCHHLLGLTVMFSSNVCKSYSKEICNRYCEFHAWCCIACKRLQLSAYACLTELDRLRGLKDVLIMGLWNQDYAMKFGLRMMERRLEVSEHVRFLAPC